MVKVETIYSEELGNEREIYIFLPPSYDADAERTYPVLYMQDGQNIFSSAGESAMMKWDVDTTALSLIEEGIIEEIIIVGISNSEWRDYEYTPTFDATDGSGGHADPYLTFLVEEVKEYIDENYRVRPFRHDTALAGSSLGGLLALYAAMEYPDFFGKIAAISPSLWWDDEIILEMARDWEIDPAGMKIWIDMGYNEDEEDDGESGNGIDEIEDDDDDDDDNCDGCGEEAAPGLSGDDDDVDDGSGEDDEGEDSGTPVPEADEDDEDDDDEGGETMAAAQETDDDGEDEPDPVEESRALVSILEEKGFVRGKNLQYFEDPWGSHNEISWGGRMGMVLTFLFGKEDAEE